MKSNYNKWLAEYGGNLLFLNTLINIPGTIPEPNILDIGCGTGSMAEYLSIFNKQVTGTEVSKSRARVAKAKIKCYHSKDGLIPLNLGVFDLIYCKEVLPSITDKDLFFKNIEQRLSKKGVFCTYLPDESDIISKPLYRFTKRDPLAILSRYKRIEDNVSLLREAGFLRITARRINLGDILLDKNYIHKHLSGRLSNGDRNNLRQEQKGLKEMLSGLEALMDYGVSVHYDFTRTLIIASK